MKTLRDPKRRPTHPGAILREDVLPALEMTQTEFAQRIGVSRLSVSELLHEKRGMTNADNLPTEITPRHLRGATGVPRDVTR